MDNDKKYLLLLDNVANQMIGAMYGMVTELETHVDDDRKKHILGIVNTITRKYEKISNEAFKDN